MFDMHAFRRFGQALAGLGKAAKYPKIEAGDPVTRPRERS